MDHNIYTKSDRSPSDLSGNSVEALKRSLMNFNNNNKDSEYLRLDYHPQVETPPNM